MSGAPPNPPEMLALTAPGPQPLEQPLSQAPGAHCCGAPGPVQRELIVEVPSKKKHVQTCPGSIVSAVLELRHSPGDGRCTRRPRGARLQDREAQRSCLAVSSLISTPCCCSPLLPAAAEAARASQEGCLVLTRDFTDSIRQSASENPEQEAVWTGWPPRFPAPSPHRPRRLLLPSSVFSRLLSISGHSTRSGFCLQEQSITCPILPHFRI